MDLAGDLSNGRYEVRLCLGSEGQREVFLAFDRVTCRSVELRIMPGDDEDVLRERLRLSGMVSHPNVRRLHDVVPSRWGPILVMEYNAGQTLHTHIRKRKAQGGYAADEFREIATDLACGLAAIHAQGLVHGDLKPANVMISEDGVTICNCGFVQPRPRSSAGNVGGPLDMGTPNYMSPERLRSGAASAEDDVYALALTLWEMWTCRVPEPGVRPRAKTMKQQIMFDVPSSLSTDEVKQIFCGLNEDPIMRPQARQTRFFSPFAPNPSSRERLDPGPPLGRAQAGTFTPGAQALLITYATNAPEIIGQVLPLDKPIMTLGRRDDQDLVIPEASVSDMHAVLRWRAGTWLIEDVNSTNGSYADHDYERKTQIALMHGAEAQVGECRIKLVSFAPDSNQSRRARQYLSKRDGLTGLLVRDRLIEAIDEDGRFGDWAEVPMQVARYELRGEKRQASEQPTILEMLALQRAAPRVVELTEMLLLSVTPVVAGRTGPLKFAVSMIGPTIDEARHVVEQVVSQVQGLLPDTLELGATLAKGEPGRSARHLLD